MGEAVGKNVFLFSGQGSQYFHMGRGFHAASPVFRDTLERLDAVAREALGGSLLATIYDPTKSRQDDFSRTLHTHPAIFLVEYALAQTLIADGIEPDYLFGCSLGEYVAAALAGVASAEDLLLAVIRAARAVETHCAPGAMLAVLDEPDLYRRDPVLNGLSYLAGINLPNHFVVSGAKAAVVRAQAHLQQRGVVTALLPVSHGFHSPALDDCRDALGEVFSGVSCRAPRVPIVSCLHGRELGAVTPAYLWDVGRQPMLFREALDNLIGTAAGRLNFIDAGPAGTLAGFVKARLGAGSRHRVCTVLSPYQNELHNYRSLREGLGMSAGMNADQVSSGMVAAGAADVAGAARPAAEATGRTAWLFPGQGSQKKGMGEGLFERFPEAVALADRCLGYSIRELCLHDPEGRLGQTRYTQPALFVVNALSCLARRQDGEPEPAFVAGHSLGEYNALWAAGVFDFATGLQLVQERARLMSLAADGAMAAVIGLDAGQVADVLRSGGFSQIGIANFNTPSQLVISGAREEVQRCRAAFEAAGCQMFMPLAVSGAFHSPLMRSASNEFAAFLDRFEFRAPRLPVISNLTARPYPADDLKRLLAEQIANPVNWVDSIRYLWGLGVDTFTEVGNGRVLTGLVGKIRQEATPLAPHAEAPERPAPEPRKPAMPAAATHPPGPPAANPAAGGIRPETLGSAEFRADHGVSHAYVAGAMVHGIASSAMVIRMGRAGLLSFFGTGALDRGTVERAIQEIQAGLQPGEPYGVNLLCGSREQDVVELCLRHGVRNVEAAGYLNLSEPLVLYRLRGYERGPDGRPQARHRVMAKVSRPEVAERFLAPAPEKIVARLREQGLVTPAQAELATVLPLADDICVEADSGGHTDGGVLAALLPAIQRQRDQAMRCYGYARRVRVGAAGGIGTPEAAAAAFILGADFVLTGSINQCTVEAGTSAAVKDLLQQVEVQDTDYAPAGDMFEIGAKVQVVKRGLFFAARANKLWDLYRASSGIDDIDEKIRREIQEKYFRRSFAEIYDDCRHYHPPEVIAEAERNPKQKMALIFRWYFGHTNRLALEGISERKLDFQVHCGPALGGFNAWVKGTRLESWQNRHVDEIGLKLMQETAVFLSERIQALTAPTAVAAATVVKPAAAMAEV